MIQVMISSRCNDEVKLNDTENLFFTDIRKDLKKEIEEIEIFGQKIFTVWINEEAPPSEGTLDSWEVCLKQAKKCDILLVLFNGNAGWANIKNGIGICHMEMVTGLSQAPGKVRLVSLDSVHISKVEQNYSNRQFQEYVKKRNLFYGSSAKDVGQLKKRTKEALHDALINLCHQGVREASKGRFHNGQALEWTRMDFINRQKAMQNVLYDAICQRPTSVKDSSNHLFVIISDIEILLMLHAIPDALSIGATKEMVGQPFLHDHEMATILNEKRYGPVHVIACHKNATESQATKLLGFPDAMVVRAPFGIYVADNIQKMQFAFIVNCRDEANTRHGVQRFFEWLEQTGEDVLMAKRAQSRARIVKAIAAEVNK